MTELSERIWCMQCGKSVSTPVPKGTVVRAYVECPECIEKRTTAAQPPHRNPVCFTCEGESGLPPTRTVDICESCYGEDPDEPPATPTEPPPLVMKD
jgi:DNA-directed RNA polymerase subunit RPC12/RpoP